MTKAFIINGGELAELQDSYYLENGDELPFKKAVEILKVKDEIERAGGAVYKVGRGVIFYTDRDGRKNWRLFGGETITAERVADYE